VNNGDSLDKEFSPCVFSGFGGEVGVVDRNGLFSKVIQKALYIGPLS
jgi:hypothetical protein